MEATYQTSRIDSFCLANLGSDSDETRRKFIRWNYQALRASPTFWLRVGQRYWIQPPVEAGTSWIFNPNEWT